MTSTIKQSCSFSESSCYPGVFKDVPVDALYYLPIDRLIHYLPSHGTSVMLLFRATVRSEASFRAMSYGQRVTRQKNVPTFQAVQMTFGHDNSQLDTSFQVGS